MNYITKKQLRGHANARKRDAYWAGSWEKRWVYMEVAIAWLESLGAYHILEAGTNGVKLNSESTTIGLEKSDIVHDLTVTPWPLEGLDFDVFVALQVWEHLKGKQQEAFNEAMKYSKNVILSLPYKWNCPGNCHHNIDEKTIFGWTGLEPTKSEIVDSVTSRRIINLWSQE